jgi:hypothetical protein
VTQPESSGWCIVVHLPNKHTLIGNSLHGNTIWDALNGNSDWLDQIRERP